MVSLGITKVTSILRNSPNTIGNRLKSRIMPTMLAAVIHEPGGPEVLKIQQWKKPVPNPGEVLIRVKAFGLNRSEMFTRQ
jgi:hypothetical protein